MSAHVLHCTLCKASFRNRAEWNDHLLTTNHQDKAKVHLLDWDEEERKCSIVIYSSFTITVVTARCIVKHFSKEPATAVFVTDVVLSASRSKTAILQFESRDKATEVFSLLKGPNIKIDGQLFQLKSVETILELEWPEFLHAFQHTLMISNHQSFLQNTDAIEEQTCAPEESTLPNSVTTFISTNSDDIPLNAQLKSILEYITIPDAEFNIVTSTMEAVKKLLEDSYPKKFIVELYRNNYLQLRNNTRCNNYLVFIYVDDDAEEFSSACKEMLALRRLYFKPDSDVCMDGETVLNSFTVRPANAISDSRVHLRHKCHDIDIILSAKPTDLSEQRLSCLVTHYCNFDSRFKQLLSLLYYWAKSNDLRFARTSNTRDGSTFVNAYQTIPEPAALEWILLFFLCNREEMIPTPEHLQQQPHKIIKSSSKDIIGLGYDGGFNEDVQYVLEWKMKQNNNEDVDQLSENSDDYSISTLRILQKFFTFYGEILTTPCLLDTFIGEIIVPWGNKKLMKHYNIKLSTPGVFPKFLVTHPLIHVRELSVDSYNWHTVVVPAMKVTSQKLERFISVWKENPSKVTRGDLLLVNVFRVE